MPDFDCDREEWLECERRRLEYFVDREEHIQHTLDLLGVAEFDAAAPAVPSCLVFHGAGGSGKTTLLEHLRTRICLQRHDLPEDQRRGAPTIPHGWVDFSGGRFSSIRGLCEEIALQLCGDPWHLELPRLEMALARHERLRSRAPGREARADVEQPLTLLLRGGRWLARLAEERELAGRLDLPEDLWRMDPEALERYMPIALALDLNDQAADPQFRRRFHCVRPLLFFDTFEEAPGGDPGDCRAGARQQVAAPLREAVRQLCRHLRGPLAVLGSREPPPWSDDPPCLDRPVEELSRHYCLEYLKARSRVLEADGFPSLPEALADAIYDLTGGHALFVAVCADICCEAVRGGGTSDAAHFGPSRAGDTDEEKLRHLLERLLRQVPADQRGLIRVAALPLHFDRELLRAALDPPLRSEVWGRFQWLTRFSFVEPVTDAPGLYSLRAAVRAVIVPWEREDNPEGFHEVHRRVREHLEQRLGLAAELEGSRTPGHLAPATPTDASAAPALEPALERALCAAWAYSSVLVDPGEGQAAVDRLVEHRLDACRVADAETPIRGWRQALLAAGLQPDWRLALCEGRLVHFEGRRREARAIFAHALELATAAGDRMGETQCTYFLSWVSWELGETQRTIELAHTALALARELGDRRYEARALHQLASVHLDIGEAVVALGLYEQALAIEREIGDRVDESNTLNQMGRIRASDGHPALALDLYQASLEIDEEMGNRFGVGVTLQSIGAVHEDRKDYARALELFEESLAISREVGDRPGEAASLAAVARVHAARGNRAQAAELQQQALQIYRQVGDPVGQAGCLYQLGRLHRDARRYDLARGFFEQALAIDRNTGNRSGEAGTLSALAALCGLEGEHERAIELYEQALSIYRELQNRLSEAMMLRSIGDTYSALGRPDEAMALYEQSLDIVREAGDPEAEGVTLVTIGKLWADQGQPDRAEAAYSQALELSRDAGLRSNEALVLYHLGLLRAAQGDAGAALRLYQQGIEIRRDLGDYAWEASLLSAMADVHAGQYDYERAVQLYHQVLDLRRRTGDLDGEARALHSLALIYYNSEQYAPALEPCRRSVELWRDLDQPDRQASALYVLGSVYEAVGRPDEAVAAFREALELRRRVGDREGQASALRSLATLESRRSNRTAALDLYSQAVQALDGLGDRPILADVLHDMGYLAFEQEDRDRALDLFEESARVAGATGYLVRRATALNWVALVRALRSEWPEALEAIEDCAQIASEIASHGVVTEHAAALKAVRNLARREEREDMVTKLTELADEILSRLPPALSNAFWAEWTGK